MSAHPQRDTSKTVLSVQSIVNTPQLTSTTLSSSITKSTDVTALTTNTLNLNITGGSVGDVLQNVDNGVAQWVASGRQDIITVSDYSVTLTEEQSGALVYLVANNFAGPRIITLPSTPTNGTYYKFYMEGGATYNNTVFQTGTFNTTDIGFGSTTLANSQDSPSSITYFVPDQSQWITLIYLTSLSQWINLNLNVRTFP